MHLLLETPTPTPPQTSPPPPPFPFIYEEFDRKENPFTQTPWAIISLSVAVPRVYMLKDMPSPC